MFSIYYDMVSIICEIMCIPFWYEHWAWLYIEHYILCASMYMCIVLHYTRQAVCPRGSHQFQFQLNLWVARMVTTRGPGANCPQYVLTVFLFAGFRSIRYVLQLCGPWAKVAYLYFIYSLYALHDCECNQIVFIRSTSKSIFLLNTS